MPPRSDDAPPPLRVNRAPVLTLWAAVAAERLGHPEDSALTLDAAVAGTAARAKARRLGLSEDRPEEDGPRRHDDAGGQRSTVRLLGREIPVARPDGGSPLAAHNGRPQSPASVRAYLARAFGDRLGEVRAAMEELAESLPPDGLNRIGFRLYERFHPEVPEGVEGWGAKAVLDIGRIEACGGVILPDVHGGIQRLGAVGAAMDSGAVARVLRGPGDRPLPVLPPRRPKLVIGR